MNKVVLRVVMVFEHVTSRCLIVRCQHQAFQRVMLPPSSGLNNLIVSKKNVGKPTRLYDITSDTIMKV